MMAPRRGTGFELKKKRDQLLLVPHEKPEEVGTR